MWSAGGSHLGVSGNQEVSVTTLNNDDLRDDKFASPRGGLDKGEHVPVGSRHVSSSPSPSHRDRLLEVLKTHHEVPTSLSPV